MINLLHNYSYPRHVRYRCIFGTSYVPMWWITQKVLDGFLSNLALR